MGNPIFLYNCISFKVALFHHNRWHDLTVIAIREVYTIIEIAVPKEHNLESQIESSFLIGNHY
jgi:hypothetical protein